MSREEPNNRKFVVNIRGNGTPITQMYNEKLRLAMNRDMMYDEPLDAMYRRTSESLTDDELSDLRKCYFWGTGLDGMPMGDHGDGVYERTMFYEANDIMATFLMFAIFIVILFILYTYFSF